MRRSEGKRRQEKASYGNKARNAVSRAIVCVIALASFARQTHCERRFNFTIMHIRCRKCPTRVLCVSTGSLHLPLHVPPLVVFLKAAQLQIFKWNRGRSRPAILSLIETHAKECCVREFFNIVDIVSFPFCMYTCTLACIRVHVGLRAAHTMRTLCATLHHCIAIRIVLRYPHSASLSTLHRYPHTVRTFHTLCSDTVRVSLITSPG